MPLLPSTLLVASSRHARALVIIPRLVRWTSTASAQAAAPPRPGGRPMPAPPKPRPINGVSHVIAVSSGKGGVGKSTVSVNLAVALARLNLRVGLLDGDIYGPSIPRMMKLVKEKPMMDANKRIQPLVSYGVKCVSVGLFVDPEAPTIWRGPMVMGALQQLLHEVEWNPTDVLVVDLPPGTGDAQLTLCQQTPLSGAVIVSTPQEVALGDVRKGVNMFRTLGVPILGLIENMSYFQCPDCTSKHYLFGEGGARATAQKMGLPFLGELPLTQRVRETSDAGTPITAIAPESEQAKAFMNLAQAIYQKLLVPSSSSNQQQQQQS